MNTPQARLPSMAPAYMRLTNTPIHFAVIPRSGASTGANTAGAEDVTAVKTWIASVATSATSAVRAWALFHTGDFEVSNRDCVAIASTTRSWGAAGTSAITWRSNAPAIRGTASSNSASNRS